jgi:hypothetical protein
LTSANGGLNNKKIALKGFMTKKKKELWGMKRTNEKYELKQLPTYNM